MSEIPAKKEMIYYYGSENILIYFVDQQVWIQIY